MIFSFVKTYLKKNFPKITNKLIQIRDNGYLKKLLNNTILIKFNKNIHGKKIVNDEKGFVLDFSKDNYISYTIRPKKSKNIAKEEKIFDEKDTAIIIQGSLYGIKDFVSETIELYCSIRLPPHLVATHVEKAFSLSLLKILSYLSNSPRFQTL